MLVLFISFAMLAFVLNQNITRNYYIKQIKFK